MSRTLVLLAVFALLALDPKPALADGGTLQLSKRVGSCQVSVFTSPAVLRAGPVDVSVLIQEVETGAIRPDVPVMVQLESVEDGVALQQEATAAAATNKLMKAAQFEVPGAGPWRALVQVGSDGTVAALVFELSVAPPLPGWLALSPWVGWPFGIVGLFAVHQMLVARARP